MLVLGGGHIHTNEAKSDTGRPFFCLGTSRERYRAAHSRLERPTAGYDVGTV